MAPSNNQPAHIFGYIEERPTPPITFYFEVPVNVGMFKPQWAKQLNAATILVVFGAY